MKPGTIAAFLNIHKPSSPSSNQFRYAGKLLFKWKIISTFGSDSPPFKQILIDLNSSLWQLRPLPNCDIGVRGSPCCAVGKWASFFLFQSISHIAMSKPTDEHNLSSLISDISIYGKRVLDGSDEAARMQLIEAAEKLIIAARTPGENLYLTAAQVCSFPFEEFTACWL